MFEYMEFFFDRVKGRIYFGEYMRTDKAVVITRLKEERYKLRQKALLENTFWGVRDMSWHDRARVSQGSVYAAMADKVDYQIQQIELNLSKVYE